MAFNGYLTPQQITELTEAALSGGLIEAPRQVLLTGIPAAFAATLPRADGALDQFALDLVRVNGVRRMANGEVPALILLGNAAGWLRLVGREEAEVFERALSSITSASAGLPASAPRPHLTTVNSAGEQAEPFGKPGTNDPTERITASTPTDRPGEHKVAGDPAAASNGQSHTGHARSPRSSALRRPGNWFQGLNVAIQAAIIGGIFVILAAVVGGIFTLVSAGGSPPVGNPSSPSVSPAVPRSSQSSDRAHSLLRLPSQGVDAVAFSLDSKYLAAGNADGIVRVWHTSTWRAAPIMTDPHSRGVTSVAFNSANSLLAAGDANGHVYVWAQNHAITLTDPSGAAIRSVAFSPDDKFLAAGDARGLVEIWRVGRWRPVSSLTDPGSSGVNSVAFNPVNSLLAAGDANGHIYLWSHSHATVLTDPSGAAVRSVVFTSDNRALVGGDSSGHIYVWHVADRKVTEHLLDPNTKGIESVAFNPRSTTIAAADGNGRVYLWLYRLTGTLHYPSDNAALSAAYSPDGSHLAVASADGNVYVTR